jgi:hypothetical protein
VHFHWIDIPPKYQETAIFRESKNVFRNTGATRSVPYAAFLIHQRMMKPVTAWPFQDPPNCVAIAVQQIVCDSGWIHSVFHDAEDGCWNFIGTDPPRKKMRWRLRSNA